MTALAAKLSGGRTEEFPIWLAMSVVSASVVIVAARAGPLAVAGAGGVLIAVGLLCTTRHTGRALALVLLYLGLADGYVKLRTGVAATTLVRDVLLYAIVVGVLSRASVRETRLEVPPLAGWVVLLVAVVGVQLANPANESITRAVAGLRPHLEFVPLFFLAYWTVRDRRALRTFLALLLTIGAVNGVVGYVQSNLTSEQLAAWGPGYRDRVLGQGGFVGAGRTFVDAAGNQRLRPLGLGSDAGFVGQLGVLAIPAGLALIGVSSRARSRAFAIALLAITVLGVTTSQTRAGVIASVLAVVSYATLGVVSRRWWATVLGIAAGALVAVAVVSLLTSDAQTGASNRYGSFKPSQVLESTQKERPLNAARDYLTEFPLGAGIGKSGPASGFGVGNNELVNGELLNGETEFSYLTTEVGLPGLLAFLSFHLFLVSLVVRRCRRVRDEEARSMLAAVGASLIAIVPLWFATATTANTPLSPFIWFAAGVLAFWLVTVPRRALQPRTGYAGSARAFALPAAARDRESPSAA